MSEPQQDNMKVTILGCGTSGGVPRIGNVWGACDPNNPKNRRRRVSILVEQGENNLLIDTSSDIREQCLDANITSLDAVLYTHDHADHTHGIDDLRGLYQNMNHKRPRSQRSRIPVYGNDVTLNILKRRFGYIFTPQQGYPAICDAHEIDENAFVAANMKIQPIPLTHGNITSFGYRIGSMAYTTDLNAIPEDSKQHLQGLDLWIVDALRPEPHPTHPHLDLTLSWIEEFKPKHAILTHMAWQMDYETLRKSLPAGVEPGYDGMVITV